MTSFAPPQLTFLNSLLEFYMAIERTLSIIKPDAVAKKRHWQDL